jgi:hypothetical protein
VRKLLQSALIAAGLMLAAPAFADIALGHVVPLTGGLVASGRELSQGAKAYIDKVNAEGGIVGHKIVYLLRDDENLAEQTLARSAELIKQGHVVGFLPGVDPAHVKSLVASGLLWQNQAVILSVRNGVAGGPSLISPGEGSTREAGLIEISPPLSYYASLIEEFRATLAKYGPADATFSSAGLQGYMAAKVMVNAVRMLGTEATREEYHTVMLHMFPDLSNQLIRTDAPR